MQKALDFRSKNPKNTLHLLRGDYEIKKQTNDTT